MRFVALGFSKRLLALTDGAARRTMQLQYFVIGGRHLVVWALPTSMSQRATRTDSTRSSGKPRGRAARQRITCVDLAHHMVGAKGTPTSHFCATSCSESGACGGRGKRRNPNEDKQ